MKTEFRVINGVHMTIPIKEQHKKEIKEEIKMADKINNDLVLKCMRDTIENNNNKVIQMQIDIDKLNLENEKIKKEIERIVHGV